MALLDKLTPHRCPDCNAAIGAKHEPGCDVERCRYCGGQALQCFTPATCPHCQTAFVVTDCGATVDEAERLPWTGIWPGLAECIEFGWFSYFVPGAGWVRCAREHPQAGPDLNRLALEAHWDRQQGRYVL